MSFARHSRHWFDPVTAQFGMSCVASDDNYLRYENARAFLLIRRDSRGSGELGVEFGRRRPGSFGPPFSLAEILRFRGVTDASAASAPMISRSSQLPVALSKLAELTRTHASDFLAGNERSFSQVSDFRKKEGVDFERQSQLRRLRSAVGAAWRERDYETVVRALEPFADHLSETEKRKLQYSRKHLAKA